jgi:hypothetical protein
MKKLKQDDIHAMRYDLNRNTRYIHTDKCAQISINAYFCSKYGNAIKKRIMQDYNQQMGHTDNGDRMTHNYLIPCHTWS